MTSTTRTDSDAEQAMTENQTTPDGRPRRRPCCSRDISQALRAGPGQRRHHDRVPRRRDPCPAGRERLGQVDAVEHRERQPDALTTAPSRSTASRSRPRRRGRRCCSGSAWRTSTSRRWSGSPSPRACTCADPRGAPPRAIRRCTSGPTANSPSTASTFAARRKSRACRQPSCSCSRWCRRCCPSPRCCCSTNPPPRSVTPTCSACTTLIRDLAGRRDGRSCTSATASPRCSTSPTGSPSSATV